VVVISSDVFNEVPYVVAVVVGDMNPKTPDQAGVAVPPEVSGFAERVVLMTTQLRTLDPSRFSDRAVGTVPPELMKIVNSRLRTFLDLRDSDSFTSARPA
jgi:mRNA-degrading endonuclease toxin of MazEF toxin-antitoxin module